MKKILFLGLILLILSCEEESVLIGPTLVEDLCGVLGGDDFNEDGYHCGDLQVIQDIMDANNITGVEPLNFTYLNYYSNEVSTQTWAEGGRLANFKYSGAYASPSLETLPESIGDLINLTGLNLRNNGISTVPESIGSLTNLTSIDLAINNLTSFPSGILSLSNLIYLDLYDNEITSLPENLCSYLPLLAEFDMGSNILCPEYYNIGDCGGSVYWEQDDEFENFCCEGIDDNGNTVNNFAYCCESDEWFSYNGTCHSQSDLDSLQDLINANTNLIYEEPYFLDEVNESAVVTWEDGRLTTLRLSNLQINNIPESFGNLTALTSINFNVNDIVTLPSSFSNLINLISLSLEFNEIEEFPETLMELPSLQYLYIGYNNITSLPESLCQNLPDLIEFNLDEMLCYEYHGANNEIYNCVGFTNSQSIEDSCCEGPNGQPAWTLCPEE